MDRGAWRATVGGAAKSWDTAEAAEHTHAQWVISELGTGYAPANKEDKILFSWSLFFNGMGR